jgi:ribosomal protein S18 acetylase RimI-like enzyme
VNWICREFSFGSPDYQASLVLRESVLRNPLGLTWTAEQLQGEHDSRHLGCYLDGELAGCLVLKPIDATTVKMRQVAILPEHQGRGAGSALVAFAEEVARKAGFSVMTAHARETAVPFYRKHGYTVEGDRFVEVTIPHYAIFKQL